MATVRVEDHEGGVRVLTLEHPPANAIEETLLAALRSAIEAAAGDTGVRTLVITGAGTFFSGGFDLTAPARDAAATRKLNELYRDTHLLLLESAKPTVAMVNGHAIAGGLVLALACDYRVAVEGSYRVGLNEVAIGASFPRIALEIVRLRLSHAQASELLLGAALHPCRDILRLGIAEQVLPAETFAATALSRAVRLGTFPREAYAHTKAALIAEAVARVRAETPEEADRAAAVWSTGESRAARATQRQKLGMRRSPA
jgi:enoyl-CoA hydratase